MRWLGRRTVLFLFSCALSDKRCESQFAIEFSVINWTCLPNANLLSVVVRCVKSSKQIGRHIWSIWMCFTFWRTPVNMWTEIITCGTKTYLRLSKFSSLPFCSLLTFKCQVLPLACALDLAALENIPSLSFRSICASVWGNEVFL